MQKFRIKTGELVSSSALDFLLFLLERATGVETDLLTFLILVAEPMGK